jgi:hypothetical protein
LDERTGDHTFFSAAGNARHKSPSLLPMAPKLKPGNCELTMVRCCLQKIMYGLEAARGWDASFRFLELGASGLRAMPADSTKTQAKLQQEARPQAREKLLSFIIPTSGTIPPVNPARGCSRVLSVVWQFGH